MNARALFAVGEGKAEMREVELGPPGAGQAQVRAMATLISPGTERAFILGLENARPKYPMASGYCAAGVVEAVGEGVTGLAPGQRVAAMMGHRTVGNIAAEKVVPLPEGVSFEEGAFLPMGVIALQGVRKARIELGESAMALGLGLVGQMALQLCKANGALPAIGVDKVEGRRALALRCGADGALDAGKANWMEELKGMTGGSGADVAIEATGYPDAVPSAFEAVRKFGRVVLLGSTRGETQVNFYRDVHRKGLTVIGAHLFANPEAGGRRPGFWPWRDDAEAFLRYVAGGRLRLREIVTNRVKSAEIEKTYGEILTWRTDWVGTVVEWG